MPTPNTNFSSGAPLPRLAMMNSFAGFGRCSTTISLPVISTMQVQVCPIPTTILSNHLAFPQCQRLDYTPYVWEYLEAWREQGFQFDGFYCGFLGNPQLAQYARKFVVQFRPDIFLLDPVMGDNGRKYASVTEEYYEYLKILTRYATILVPNIFEACLLTDTPYHDGEWSFDELDDILAKLRRTCKGKIVITGLPQEENILNYIWDGDKKATCVTPKAGAPHHGTGDLFASILIADALYGRDFTASVQKASDFVALCIRGTENVGAPEIEGVLFEKYLHKLL